MNLSKNKKAAIEFIGKELIIDGQIIEENLAQNGITEQWLLNQLNVQGINDTKEVILAIITSEGKLYVDKKTDQVPDQ